MITCRFSCLTVRDVALTCKQPEPISPCVAEVNVTVSR